MTEGHDKVDIAVLGGGPAHAHPTLPEGMLEAALGFRDAAIHTHTR